VLHSPNSPGGFATSGPAFGQADLTNCEREQIHLAGSIQPHGVLLVLRGADLQVVQASANVKAVLGLPVDDLLGRPVARLGADLVAQLRDAQAGTSLDAPTPVQCTVESAGRRIAMEGSVHRHVDGSLLVELEPLGETPADTVQLSGSQLRDQLGAALKRLASASSIGVLADASVSVVRDLTGYDRVMVYRFDPDGHGKIIAEARDPRLDSLLGHHYPASDIPQRARELYVRNRVRVLVDVHYTAVPLVPRLLPAAGGAGGGAELDMSLSYLRSMSPLHIQYLKNMGVTATLVVSLVREGRLWGLIACHHYTPRNLRYAVRAACELLAEVVATRIAAIENYAYAQVAILVRRLEQRLIDATSTEGDWRLALFRNPRTLLQPLDATGAALFHEDEILTAGEVPSTPELRALRQWIDAEAGELPFSCSTVGRTNPSLASLTPTASGVLAVRLSSSRPDYLMWFRKEQLLSVTWAGDPTKPVIGNDPLELSPRRSFAAWSEIVRGTAMPWSGAEIALARAIGMSLADIVLQVHAVRLLIAEFQLAQTRATVTGSREPVVVADAAGRVLLVNGALREMFGTAGRDPVSLDEAAGHFAPAERARQVLGEVVRAQRPWRGELALARGGAAPLPVDVRAEVVPGRDGAVLGYIVILTDLSDAKRASAARRHLEQSLSLAARETIPREGPGGRSADELMNAIVDNANLAALDIADAMAGPNVAPLLEELEQSTLRATALYAQIRSFAG
jgi:light-regulated signal transduction histidine kinase (bacteriophytochrome)